MLAQSPLRLGEGCCEVNFVLSRIQPRGGHIYTVNLFPIDRLDTRPLCCGRRKIGNHSALFLKHSIWLCMLPDSLILFAQVLEAEGGPVPFRWSNVQDANGIAVAILGMTIVFAALILISLAITALPRILQAVSPYLPQVEEPHDAPPPAERTAGDEQMVIAAIGYVLHTEMQKAMKK